MIKTYNYYHIAFLLFISLTASQGRFLQTSSSTTNSTNPLVRTFKQELPCGECILGGYVYCVKGPEGYSGSEELTQQCCFDKSLCERQIDTTQYNCTFKYSSTMDMFKVCPFKPSACGTVGNLTLDGLGDTECVRLRNLTRGNACYYNLKSQCGVPNF